ncbi:zinc finger protein 271-like [Hetaerina americana]|uniref:zinc finger protein 271-like n=1 Tax=Hetaerina americana TaxID=62018 RepID=UPI003A7F3175
MSVDGGLFLCRLCLKSDACHVNVFVANGTDGILVFEVIQDLLRIEVNEDDGLPSTACRDCCAKLGEFSNFKKMCVRSARELKRKRLTQDWRVLGADGRVQRPSQTLPVEVFVKAEEDCGLPSKNDGSSMERDPLCMSEEALPSTLITMSDDRVFREERFSESSPATGNPITLQRVIKQEVDEDALETSTIRQQGPITNVTAGEEGCAFGVVHSGGKAVRRHISGSEEDGTVEDDAVPQGLQSFDLHSNQKKTELGYERGLSTVQLGYPPGTIAAVVPSSIEGICVRNGRGSEEMSVSEEEGSGICGNNKELWGGRGISLCSPRGSVPSVGSVEVVRADKVSLTGEDNVVDLGDDSARGNERKAMSDKVKVLKCDACGNEFDTKESIQKHVRQHGVELFNCSLCFVGFIRKDEYERHSFVQHGIGPDEDKRIHKRYNQSTMDNVQRLDSNLNAIPTGKCTYEYGDEKSRTCDICNKTFSRKSHLKSHIAVHSKEKPYSCGLCTKSFTTKSNLNAHMMSLHTDSKRHWCSVCFKSFARRGILRAHMTLHTGTSPHSCTVCAKSFTTDAILKAHMALHTGISPHMCTVCEKAFTTDSNLKTHMLTHTGVRPHTCSVCAKSFPTKSVLKVHMSVHVESKPYSCDICGKAFTRKYILREHTALHSGDRPYSCTVCAKTFVAKGILKTHMAVHSGDRTHTCSSCSKTFSTKGNLKSHMMVHSGEKPHRCGICPRSFPTKGNLNAHMTVHSGERPHSCGICSKTFTRKGNLKKHSELHKTTDLPKLLDDETLHKS